MPVVAVHRAPFRTGENGEVAGGVRGHAVGYDVEANRTVATALDAAVGGLADDGEIAGDPIGMGLDDFA